MIDGGRQEPMQARSVGRAPRHGSNAAAVRRPRTWFVLLAVGGLLLGGACAAFAWTRAASARSGQPSCEKVFPPNLSPGPTIFVERDHGDLVGITSFGTWGTSECVLRTRLTFAVKRYASPGPGATVRGIVGSPAAVRVDSVLRPGSVVVVSWRWRNWCGPTGRFQLEASWGQSWLAWTRSVRAPACGSRSSSSTMASKPSGLRPCAPDAYRTTTSIGMPIEQRMIDTVAIDLRAHRAPCLLERERVSLAVQRRADGRWATVREIDGNPGQRTIGAVLAAGEPAPVYWAWTNWCHGDGDTWRTLAKVGNRQVAGAATRSQDGEYPPPDCSLSSGRPSTLTNSYGYVDGPDLGARPAPLLRVRAHGRAPEQPDQARRAVTPARRAT